MTLYYIALGRALGLGSCHPVKIYRRFAAAIAIAALVGWSVASAAHATVLSAIPHAWRLCFSLFYVFQLIGCAAIYTAGCFQKNNTLVRWMLTLPLPLWRISSISLLPSVLLASLFFISSAPAIFTLFNQLGVGWPLFALSAVLGLAASLGTASSSLLIRLFSSCKKFPQAALPAIILGSEYYILHLMQQNMFSASVRLYITTGILVITYATTLLLSFLSFRSLPRMSLRSKTAHPVRSRLPRAWWIITYAWRTATIRSGMCVTTALSILAIFSVSRLHVIPAAATVPIAAFLAATAVTDLRSIFQLSRPPEVVALKGTNTFVRSTFFASLFVGYAAVLSLLVFAVQQNTMAIDRLLLITLVGIAIGNSVGHIFASSYRGIIAPLAAMAIVFICVCFIPGKAFFASLAWWWQDSYYFGLVLAFRWAAEYVEYKRGAYIWRKL